MTTPAATINIGELLANSRVGPLQKRVFILCALCLIIDGFDVQAMGYVAPALVPDWKIDRSALGPVFSAANFGVLIGSLVFSTIADKIGRRPVLVGATLFFSAMTIATAYAQNINQLFWLRLIAGIGMGCIIPNATALVGEFSPAARRVTLMMTITVGFTAGAALGGFVAAWMIPQFGWRSVFLFGGAVPLVIGVAMLVSLPESLQFLAVRRRPSTGAQGAPSRAEGRRLDQLAKWLTRLDPTIRVDASTKYIANEESRGGVPFVHLFRDGRGLVTILLWVINFMNLLNLYSLSNWLPTVVASMGYDTRTAVLVGTLLQVGGTIGTFGLAWLIARGGFVPMLTMTFAIATISIFLIGSPGISLALLVVIVFIAGWCVVGGQPGMNALAATFYPTYLRTTGVGFALGIGRVGAIVGPYIGGRMMAAQFTNQQLFWAAAVPALVSTLTLVVLSFAMKGKMAAPVGAAPMGH
jgi:MFS transporter, AAHS family, 4-hydroxybenzoate transporter